MAESTLHYEEQGTGTPVVLLHGFPFDHTIWRAQLAAVSREARVLAPDLPGFGASPPPPWQPAIADYVEALAAWAAALGLPRFVLAGHSMGGYIALGFARTYPDRLAGLGLVCTRSGPDTEPARQNRFRLIAALDERGPQAVVDAMLPTLLAPATREQHPAVVDEVRAVMLRQPNAGLVSALWAMAGRPDSTPFLGTIAVPTLVASGADDAIIPAAESDLLAASITGAVHVPIPSAGHLPMLEQPDRLGAALAGLARGASSRVPRP